MKKKAEDDEKERQRRRQQRDKDYEKMHGMDDTDEFSE